MNKYVITVPSAAPKAWYTVESIINVDDVLRKLFPELRGRHHVCVVAMHQTADTIVSCFTFIAWLEVTE